MKFEGEQAALRYLVSAGQKGPALNLLSGTDIARILDSRYRAVKAKIPGLAQLEGLEQLVPELIRVLKTSELLSEETRAAILKYAGLSEPELADDGAVSLQDLLTKLKDLVVKVTDQNK